jgi:lipopolysaccharide/colanic/teichoic acid biosynthesis glycosyltransferase
MRSMVRVPQFDDLLKGRLAQRRVELGAFPREPLRRCLELLVTLSLLLVVLPIFLAVVAGIMFSSPGPAFFRQTRIGRGGAPFTMYKFRTMRLGAGDATHRQFVTALLTSPDVKPGNGALYKLTDDDRVTRIGHLLRRYSLDELPQLLNVVRGQMSLVGPRPMLPWEHELLGDMYQERFDVKPGMTGLWQVSGRSRLTMRQALDLDVEYVRSRTLSLDARILARTIPVVLFARDAV